MSKEMGLYLSHLRNESTKKGKDALVFSIRALVPAMIITGALGTIGAGILTGMHGQTDKEFSARVKIEIAATLLSFVIFTAPFIGKKMVDKLKKNKANVNSPESTEEP